MIKTIIDTDPGVDDALAIIYALNHSKLPIHTITTVSGNVCVDQASLNSRIILDQLRQTTPIVIGQNQPICYELQMATHFHGQDGLGNVTSQLDYYNFYEKNEPVLADETILSLVKTQPPSSVRLICIGPLTNIAQAILADAEQMKKVSEIVLMGGAFECYGNVTSTAEFNIYVDPQAAAIVFSSGIPITVLPLDITRQVEITADQLHTAMSNSNAPWREFVWSITQLSMDFHQRQRGSRGLYLHDPLAVGYVLRPDLFKTIEANVRVETRSDLTRGMTVADLRHPSPQPNAQICVQVNTELFLNHFLSTIFDLS